MSVSNGPRRGLMINALTGDGFDASFRAFLRAFDALFFCSVVNLTTSAPPGSPANGATYIVKASGSGAWAGHDNAVAIWTTDNPAAPGGEWEFYAAGFGMIIANVADSTLYFWNGSAWTSVAGGGGSSTLAGDSDVTLTSPSTGQVLTWNGTKWVNSTPSGGGGGSSTLAGDTDVVISSPANNDVLAYETSSTKWKNKPAAGGGGGIPSGTNIWLAQPRGTATDNNSGYTVFGYLSAGAILAFATSWKFSIVFSGSVTITGAVVYRTLPNSLTIIDATPVTFGGAALPYTNGSGGEIFSDAIALPLDGSHDYYVAITGSTTTYVVGLPGAGAFPIWQARGGYISGNQTGLTTGGTIPGLGAESDIFRIVAT